MNRNSKSILPRPGAAALCMILLLSVLAGAAGETKEDRMRNMRLRNGSRDSRRIAITMDDANETEWVWKSAELCRQYGIAMTFFPVGINLKEEDRANWLDVLAAGCEIGSHSYSHLAFHDISRQVAGDRLDRFREALDKTLGVHYPVRWFRPPYGSVANRNGPPYAMYEMILDYGYDHILLWDVSETNPDKALRKVRNGSILLYHAREKDYNCLVRLIPALLEAGYEPVTVSELFGMEPPVTGGELFVRGSRE